MTVDQDRAEIRAVVYRMAERYGAKDVEGTMATFVGEHSSVIGTGTDEIRFGNDAVQFQMARDMSEPDTLSFAVESLHVDVFADSAFAFANAVFHATFRDDVFRFPVRTTFGMVRTDVGWRIAQIHTSIAHREQPEGRSFPVKLTRTLSDLLTSIDSAAASSSIRAKALGTATFLFTDIVDSTALSQSMGDDEWSAVVSEHFDTVGGIVEGQGGSVVKTLGDGGMFVFPSGTSALLAAIDAQRAVTSSRGRRLSIRAGVHTGDVIQGQGDYIGLTVNKAARVAAAAAGDQILASSTTAEVVNHSSIELGEPLTAELKGLEGTHLLFPVNWAQGSP